MREKVLALPESDLASSQSYTGSLPLFDHDGESLRTCLLSVLADMTGLRHRWKRSATPAGRSWWVLSTSARRIGGTGFFWWYTPTFRDWKGRSGSGFIERKKARNKGGHITNLCDQCHELGRRDLERSAKFRLKLMGFPVGWLDDESGSPPLVTRCRPSSRKSLEGRC